MPTNHLDNYYARLGIAKSSTSEEIKQAYRRAARQFHPDANAVGFSGELFRLIQEAYETLSSPEKRAAYDATLADDIEGSDALMVNTLYSRNLITPGREQRSLYVLLNLMPAPNEETAALMRPPVNMCLVLDNSTSMAGPRLKRVVNAAVQFIEKIQRQDILAVVTFNDRPEVLVPASIGQDRAHITAQLRSLHCKGGTEIYPGLEAGLKEVQRHQDPSYTNHVILITDGRTYGDEKKTLGLARLAASQGITISVVGIGEDWNEDFIDQLVSNAGGNSVYAARSADIQKLLQDKFDTINESFANNVKLHFKLGKDVALHYAFRISPDASSIAPQAPLFLGNVPLDDSLTVLMEFGIGEIRQPSGELLLAQGELSMDIPFHPVPATKTRFRLSLPIDNEAEPETPPQVLVDAIAQLSIYRVQEEVREQIKRGDAVKAAKRMRMLATHMLSSGQRSLARTFLLAAEQIKEGQPLDSKSGKQIKYGTRSLIDISGQEDRTQ